MAQPRAEATLRGDRRRRRRPRAGDRLLPGQRAWRARCRGARKRLAGRWQHRAQHHDHSLQLPVGRERPDLRPRRQAVGEPLPRAEFQRHVQPARRRQPRAQPARPAGDQAATARQPAERHRQRVSDARGDQTARTAAQHLARRALSDSRRLPAAARRHGAARRGRLGLRPRAPMRRASTSSRTAR